MGLLVLVEKFLLSTNGIGTHLATITGRSLRTLSLVSTEVALQPTPNSGSTTLSTTEVDGSLAVEQFVDSCVVRRIVNILLSEFVDLTVNGHLSTFLHATDFV